MLSAADDAVCVPPHTGRDGPRACGVQQTAGDERFTVLIMLAIDSHTMTGFRFRIGHTEFNFGVPALLGLGMSLAAALVLLVYVDVLRGSVLRGAEFYEAQRLADTRHTLKKPDAKRSNGTPREVAVVSK